ncbi:mitogen-activated protein kinase kinase kinase NPK1-like [Wolffia australiana]
MQEIFGSVRRSFVFRQSSQKELPGVGGGGGIADRIGTCLRKSRAGLAGIGLGLLPRLQPPPNPLLIPPIVLEPASSDNPDVADDNSPIRWRKGELIGCGAFGHVYMGMNLDSGELLAVKQVFIGTSNASKQKAQDNIRELEEEVKLLRKLTHPNIVRYLGTAREEDTLNILLEFVPGGSISSLLGKFGSFPEAVIRMYTKQLLQGLEYLHQNGIIHRDIKGANILVDNKGCIKLVDFGASKQVAKLATLNAAKSMKGTPYWMAPEVIVQTGHSFSADIWSVGCTVIEMATGKPPWSQQYQEVAVLYHIGTTKSHPPIPEHLSPEAKDFLLKCLQKEPNLRATASDLLRHPFVTGDGHPTDSSSLTKPSSGTLRRSRCTRKEQVNPILPLEDCEVMNSMENFNDGGSCSPYQGNLISSRPIWETNEDDNNVCQLEDVCKSFNPMSEPLDEDWPCKFDASPEKIRESGLGCFSFPSGPPCEDDEEVTEIKIRAFLVEKALELKKLQTPLYEEFHSTMKSSNSKNIPLNTVQEKNFNNSKLPPKIRASPSRRGSGPADGLNGSPSVRLSGANSDTGRILREIPSPRLNQWDEGRIVEDPEQRPNETSNSFLERQRRWKEELDQELANQREMMRLAGSGGSGSGRTSSPKDSCNRKRDISKLTSLGK